MREYGFTQAERNTYFDQQKVYSSFGRDTLNDFIVLHVYSPDSTSADNANLLGTKILSLGEVELENGGNFIDVNVGQHLRDMGLVEGEYKVVYKFLRRLAGRERTILVDGNGQVWTGDYKVKILHLRNGVRVSEENTQIFIKKSVKTLVKSHQDMETLLIWLSKVFFF